MSESGKAQMRRWLKDLSICYWTFTMRFPVQGPAPPCPPVIWYCYCWDEMHEVPKGKRPPGSSPAFTSVDTVIMRGSHKKNSKMAAGLYGELQPTQSSECIWVHACYIIHQDWGTLFENCTLQASMSPSGSKYEQQSECNCRWSHHILKCNLPHMFFFFLYENCSFDFTLEEWTRGTTFYKQLPSAFFWNSFWQIKPFCRGPVKALHCSMSAQITLHLPWFYVHLITKD